MATRKDAKEELPTTSPSQLQKEHHQAVNKALDETKDEIKVATREAAREIPQYTQRLGDIQEQTIQTTREIADNYIESQKEIISTALQRTKDNSKEFSRLGVNTAKVFHEATNDVANTGFYAAETVPSSRPRR